MADNTIKQSLEKCDHLAELHLGSIEMWAKAGKEMIVVGVEPPKIIDVVLNSILLDARHMQKILKEIVELHDAEWRDSGSANPSRSLVDAARNDAAVLNLIKRASKKTPIRDK